MSGSNLLLVCGAHSNTSHCCGGHLRSLFAAAGIKLPPGGILPVSRRSLNTTPNRGSSASADGSAGSTGLKQLLLAMSLQLLQWPQQEKWLIKINSGSSGVTGLALLDTAEMQVGLPAHCYDIHLASPGHLLPYTSPILYESDA